MRICVLLPYANPHVTGWLNEYVSISRSSITIGISKSVQQFRSNYFIDADNDTRYLYLFQGKKIRAAFAEEMRKADVVISLGIFNKEFITYMIRAKKGVRLYVLSEPYNPFTGNTSGYVKSAYSLLLRMLVPARNISFLAIGGKDVKDYYTTLGFPKAAFYNFGYFPKLDFLNAKGRSGNVTRFLFIGQLIERKGIPVLIQLAEYLSGNFTDWELVIIGGGDKLHDIKLLTERHSQVKYIGVINNQAELFNYYRSADILFLPSYFDGWGAVVNEGLSFGCSLLLSKHVYAAVDLLIDGENGYSFDPKNINSLLTKVDHYFEKDDVLAGHSKKSLEIFKVWNHINAAKFLYSLIEYGKQTDNEYKLLNLI